MSQTKTKLMQAKQYIQAEEYEKARRILKGIDHPTAAKWLQKLDIIAPPKKSNPQTAMFIKLGLIVAGLLIVIVFAISQVNENRAIDNRIEETHQRIEQAINDCREYGYTGRDFDDCVERHSR